MTALADFLPTGWVAPGGLDPVTRPNGKVYRPRLIRGEVLYDDDTIESQVLVLGTHDIYRAEAFAFRVVQSVDKNYTVHSPRLGWWRHTVRDYEPYFEPDEVRGAAGVMFDICDP